MLPDAEQIAVAWVKANAALTALLAGRVSTRLPFDPVFPFLRVVRIGGGPDLSDAPIDEAMLQWDAYGTPSPTKASPDYGAASSVIRTLEANLEVARGPVGALGTILGVRILEGPIRMEEEESGWARYRLDTLLQIY